MNIKVGFGFDVHRLQEGIDFFLGGVKVDHHRGAAGHSDADVLIHSICDALLGAAGLRDIGHQFPDTDMKFKGIDSKILLKKVVELLDSNEFSIGNVDATVILEKPKIAPYVQQMKYTLAPIMKIKPEDISIKATTNEKLGYVGREEGVSAYAVVLIGKK